jgi:hypothetical protein
MKRRHRFDSKYSDQARLNDLAQQYGLAFKRTGMIYRFDDYTAFGLDQALGYVEGYDRAVSAYSLLIPPAKTKGEPANA